ncbi:MAG TPA: LLM class flavin-dependent oxidoreductase [Solirubrobacteraceae bacterium]|jgi:alkanesulfonate monooxygenase SsuD/methylene tetrahydromethanopterin reductase-like flavin-dependent oxidoreductase (luciferase family)|nr:LLM class flavin-dependent oxidoreductase [Solirubrobacteraceae bacterium]
MEVGLQMIFQNTHDGLSDAEMFRRETEVAIRAEPAGLDFVLAPEHHFDPNYSMVPDNMQWLTHLGARTSRIKVGTGAIILPWWPNPTRVAEKVSMLDILTNGRLMVGFGRGLARKEYEAFGIDMNQSRERFDTAAELIMEMLETGVAEYDTKYFKQSRTEIHPRPEPGLASREFFSVAMTPDSAEAAARIGATMMTFVQLPFEQHAEAASAWRARFTELHPDRTPGAPVFTDFTYCHEDPEVAEKVAREYLAKYYLTVIKHYDFDGSHWGETQGYQAYQAGADMIKEVGLQAAVEGFIQSQCWGTPEQMVEKIKRRIEVYGHEIRAALAVSYAGMPFDTVQASLDLIGEKVVPVLHELRVPAAV